MDDLAALIIQKLREDDGPTRGMVALASWWYSDERFNLMVQPVIRNGRLAEGNPVPQTIRAIGKQLGLLKA